MSTFIIRTAADAPADLRAALPLYATTLRCLSDMQGRGEHWCARLDEPVKYRFPAGFRTERCQLEFLGHDDAGEFLWVQIVVVDPICADERLGPGMRGLAVRLAYVVDLTLGRDEVLDPSKIEPIAEVEIDDHTQTGPAAVDITAEPTPPSSPRTRPGSGHADEWNALRQVGSPALLADRRDVGMGERGRYLVAAGVEQVHHDRLAARRPAMPAGRAWRAMVAAPPRFRTRRAGAALLVAGAAVAVVGAVVLTGHGPAGSPDAPTPVAPEPTRAQPTPSRAPTSRSRPPAPPPPPPAPPADTRNPVAPPRQNWPRQASPSQETKPEIGVTRTPATRSPLSVAPEPVTPPKTATPG